MKEEQKHINIMEYLEKHKGRMRSDTDKIASPHIMLSTDDRENAEKAVIRIIKREK